MTRRQTAVTLAAVMVLRWCGSASGQAADPPPDAAPAGGPFLPGLPLAALKVTRERPLFLPSRRAPQAVPVAVVPRETTPVHVEEPLRLTLLGIIRSPEGAGSAVVMDEATHTSSSLRPGDNRRGWVVRSVEGDSVTLQKQERTTRLTFQRVQAPALKPAE